MKFAVGIQARQGSSRLPNKVLFPLGDSTVLGMACDVAAKLSDIWSVLCTEEDSIIRARYKSYAFPVGMPVSKRFLEFGILGRADYIVRLCGDQPFVDINRARRLMRLADDTGADYCGYIVDSVPAAVTSYGIYAEVVSVGAFQRAESSDHVTQPIYSRPDKFKCEWIYDDPVRWRCHKYSLCIDTLRDYYRIKEWWERHGGWPTDPGGHPHKNFERYKAWL